MRFTARQLRRGPERVEDIELYDAVVDYAGRAVNRGMAVQSAGVALVLIVLAFVHRWDLLGVILPVFLGLPLLTAVAEAVFPDTRASEKRMRRWREKLANQPGGAAPLPPPSSPPR